MNFVNKFAFDKKQRRSGEKNLKKFIVFCHDCGLWWFWCIFKFFVFFNFWVFDEILSKFFDFFKLFQILF